MGVSLVVSIRIGRTVSLFPSVPLLRATRVPHSSSDIPAISSVSLLRVLRYATFITISLLVLTLFTVFTGRFIYLSFSLTSTESLQVGYPPTLDQTLIVSPPLSLLIEILERGATHRRSFGA